MKNGKSLIFVVSAFLILACSELVFGQADKQAAAPSYEARLLVIIGQSEGGAKGELPQDLNAISRHLRQDFAFQNYRIANTFIGRISGDGSLEYKSVSDVFGQPIEQDAPIFLEWSLGRLQNLADSRGQSVLYAQPFRFGARVPVRVAGPRGGDGRAAEVLNYESVGLNMNRVSLPEGKPTLIGTLSLPKTAGTMFLVLTVRPVDN